VEEILLCIVIRICLYVRPLASQSSIPFERETSEDEKSTNMLKELITYWDELSIVKMRPHPLLRKSENKAPEEGTTCARIKFFVWTGPIILASDS
jgi:hypothetical protein